MRVLTAAGHHTRAIGRSKPSPIADWHQIDDLRNAPWDRHLRGTDILFHLAAKAHAADTTESEVRSINVEATEFIVREAVRQGVEKVIFLSSVKAQARVSRENCLRESDTPKPDGIYGKAKKDAEERITKLCRGSSTSYTIIRSPVVYGPGVKGNLLSLLKLIDRGLPLPFQSVSNQRSLISVDNLVDVLVRCITGGDDQTYLVSDGDDLSTPELIREMAFALGKKPLLLPINAGILRNTLRILGLRFHADRLIGNLCVNIQKVQTDLSWSPRFNRHDVLQSTAQWYKETTSS